MASSVAEPDENYEGEYDEPVFVTITAFQYTFEDILSDHAQDLKTLEKRAQSTRGSPISTVTANLLVHLPVTASS